MSELPSTHTFNSCTCLTPGQYSWKKKPGCSHNLEKKRESLLDEITKFCLYNAIAEEAWLMRLCLFLF